MPAEAEEETQCCIATLTSQISKWQLAVTAGFINELKVLQRETSGSPLGSPHRPTLQNRLEYGDA